MNVVTKYLNKERGQGLQTVTYRNDLVFPQRAAKPPTCHCASETTNEGNERDDLNDLRGAAR